jgi:hypothetical protein
MDKDEHGDECDDDADGDGYDKTEDCNDLNPNIKPSAMEICNNIDDNCNNLIDDNAVDCINFFKDADKDKFGAMNEYKCLCNTEAPYNATNSLDCDDGNAEANPQKAEKCSTEFDDDCDGQVNEEGSDGCKDYYFDFDGDDFGVTGNKKCLCVPAEYYRGTKSGDCNDYDKDVNPGHENNGVELCNGKDDDCDGSTDEGNPDLDKDGIKDCVDLDRDGDGVANESDNCPDVYNPSQGNLDNDTSGDACDSDADGDGYDKTADCNDLNKNIYPGAAELCNGLDDDCDGYIDNSAVNCVIYYRDHDEDNYGDPNDFQCMCSPSGEYKSLNPSDCNDSDALINPKSQEKCDDCFRLMV